MNRETFEVLLECFVFETFPYVKQEFLHSIMSTPTKAMSAKVVIAEGVVPKVAMVAEGAAPEVAPVEVQAEVPKSPRKPRPRTMPN